MNITVKPQTKRKIRSSIIRGDKGKNTAGKIIDSKFKP